MELEIMYPEIIVFSILLALLPFFFKRREKNFKEGVIVANSRYVKNTNYYKNILIKYRIYYVIIIIFTICAVLISGIITSRYHTIYKVGEEVNNRDIMLCMDISESVKSLNKNLIGSLKQTIKELKTERFGITVFDSSPLSLMPLTTDYNYALSILDNISSSLNTKYNPFNPTTGSYVRDYLYAGVNQSDGRGNSLVGDGLSFCATRFDKNDKRTKIIILTTDNDVIGNELISLSEASSYCALNNIKVFAIGTENTSIQLMSYFLFSD